jgi:hypothetical protein
MTDISPEYIEDSQQEYDSEVWPAEQPPAYKTTVRRPPEFGSCMTWAVPQVGIGTPVQILQRQAGRFKAKLIVTNAGTSIVFNSKLDPLQGANPQGFTVTAIGALPDWESQQPLYAIATGAGGSVSVWDETYSLR